MNYVKLGRVVFDSDAVVKVTHDSNEKKTTLSFSNGDTAEFSKYHEEAWAFFCNAAEEIEDVIDEAGNDDY